MKQPRFADDKVVFDVSEGRVLPVLASIFFVAIGVSILNFVSKAWDTDPVFLAVAAFGVLALVLPLWLMARVFAEALRPGSPQSLVFDQADSRLRVLNQRFDEQKYSADRLTLPGYAYSQLSGFALRSWMTSGSGDTTSTRVWIVTVEKLDGSVWDLFSTTSKNDAEALRQRLATTVALPGAAPSGETQASPTPKRWQKTGGSLGPVWFWSRPSHLVSTLLGLALVVGFASGFTVITARWLVIALLGDLVFAAVLFLLAKGLKEGGISWRNFRALRLTSSSLEVGLVPKSNLTSFVATTSLAVEGLRSVRFSFSLHEKQRARPVLELVGDQVLPVELEGLSAGDAIALQRELEAALTRATRLG